MVPRGVSFESKWINHLLKRLPMLCDAIFSVCIVQYSITRHSDIHAHKNHNHFKGLSDQCHGVGTDAQANSWPQPPFQNNVVFCTFSIRWLDWTTWCVRTRNVCERYCCLTCLLIYLLDNKCCSMILFATTYNNTLGQFSVLMSSMSSCVRRGGQFMRRITQFT